MARKGDEWLDAYERTEITPGLLAPQLIDEYVAAAGVARTTSTVNIYFGSDEDVVYAIAHQRHGAGYEVTLSAYTITLSENRRDFVRRVVREQTKSGKRVFVHVVRRKPDDREIEPAPEAGVPELVETAEQG